MAAFVFPIVSIDTTGLATEAKQDTMITSLAAINSDTTSIDGKTPALGAAVIAASVPVNIASDQTVPISAVSLPLPTGAATSANQTTANSSLSTIAGDTTSLDAKTPALGAAVIAASTPVNIASDQTVPVSAASLPLPTGAATAANQATANSSLSTIAGDTTSLDTKVPDRGSALTADSMPVNIASDQTVPISASSLPLPSGAATSANQNTSNGHLTTINTSTASVDTKFPDRGAALTADSVPVNIASDQTVPISATALPLPTGAATSALQTTGNAILTTINTSLDNIETDIGLLEDRLSGSFVPDEFDFNLITYRTTGNGIGEIDQVVYRTGGSGGTIQATLTLVYDSSDRLSTVTKV